MSGSSQTIKNMLSINLKQRDDSITDQFHRILMMKVLMVAAMVLGLNWFHDSITCIVPGSAGISAGYVQQACWIQGLYIFKELEHETDARPISYYGIPKSLTTDGKYTNGKLCGMKDRARQANEKCDPMEKTFYLQYQWFPLFVACLAFLYYCPYILFRNVNSDLISLKKEVSEGTNDPSVVEKLMKTFFSEEGSNRVNTAMNMALNLLVKIAYIGTNVLAFNVTNLAFNGDFKNYGSKWMKWSRIKNEDAHAYARYRDYPKPSEILVPTFGMCEVTQISNDVKVNYFNTHRFVCEVSQHVLYQYTLVILWCAFVVGFVVSSLGLVQKIVDHIITITCFLRQGGEAWKVYRTLTLRECEYLEFVRRKDLVLYHELVQQIKWQRVDKFNGNDPRGLPVSFQKLHNQLGDQNPALTASAPMLPQHPMMHLPVQNMYPDLPSPAYHQEAPSSPAFEKHQEAMADQRNN